MSSPVSVDHLHHLLAEEEQQGPIAHLSEVAPRKERRARIAHALTALSQELCQYQRRLESLPALPDTMCIQWAQQILRYPNGRLLVVDTVFPAESAAIVQMLVLDFAGRVRWYACTGAGYHLAPADIDHLSIDLSVWEYAVPLAQIWSDFAEALRGCYCLAAGWRQLCVLLDQEACTFHLEPILLIGDDVLPWYTRFYQTAGVIGLPTLCALLGHPLPARATITERARGHLLLLESMAQGITGSCTLNQTGVSFSIP